MKLPSFRTIQVRICSQKSIVCSKKWIWRIGLFPKYNFSDFETINHDILEFLWQKSFFFFFFLFGGRRVQKIIVDSSTGEENKQLEIGLNVSILKKFLVYSYRKRKKQETFQSSEVLQTMWGCRFSIRGCRFIMRAIL